MERSPDYILEIGSLQPIDSRDIDAAAARDGAGAPLRGRPWLAVYWKCCHVYSRVYRNADASAYAGLCPSCGRRVRARIGPNGVSGRFFTAK